MGQFEEMMKDYRPPNAEDVSVSVAPLRREAREAAAAAEAAEAARADVERQRAEDTDTAADTAAHTAAAAAAVRQAQEAQGAHAEEQVRDAELRDEQHDAQQESAALDEDMAAAAERLAEDAAVPLRPAGGTGDGPQELGEEGLPGQHGGTSSPGAATASQQAASAPLPTDPAPETGDDRQDPDDAADEQEQEQEAPEPEAAAAAMSSSSVEAAPVPEPGPVLERAGSVSASAAPVAAAPAEPGTTLPFAPGVGFSFGEDGKGENAQFRFFPKELVDRLRAQLAATAGTEFAKQLSTPAVVTAFVLSRLGSPMETDANTASATAAFRASEPRLEAIEDSAAEMQHDVHELAKGISVLNKRMIEMLAISETSELMQTYILMDRLLGMSSNGVTERTFDPTQPLVLTARDRARDRSKALRDVERRRDGRPIS